MRRNVKLVLGLATAAILVGSAWIALMERGERLSDEVAAEPPEVPPSEQAEGLAGHAAKQTAEPGTRSAVEPASSLILADEEESFPPPGEAWVQGRVVDESGKPVEQAHVTVGLTNFDVDLIEASTFRWKAELETDRDGRFLCRDVPADRWPSAFVLLKHRERAHGQFGPEFLVAENVNDLGDLVLRRGGAIVGHVVDEDGLPRGEVEVTWLAQRDWRDPRVVGEAVRSSVDGGFRIDRVPEGVFRLCAHAPGFVEEWSDPVPVAEGRTTKGLQLVMKRAMTLEGRVFEEDTRAGVEAEIVFKSTGKWYKRRPEIRIRSDSSGAFVLEGLSLEGDYAFSAEAEGYFGGGWKVTVDDELLETGLEITITPIEAILLLELNANRPIPDAEILVEESAGEQRVLGRTDHQGRCIPPEWPAWSSMVQVSEYQPHTLSLGNRDAGDWVIRLKRARNLEVHVTENGTDVPGAIVELRSAGSPHQINTSDVLERARTDAKGCVSWSDLWFDNVIVLARTPDRSRGAVRVPMGRTTLEVGLKPLSILEGTVFTDGAGPKRIVAHRKQYELTFETASSDDGSFRLEGLFPGEYLVALEGLEPRDAFAHLSIALQVHGVPVTLAPGEVHRLDLESSPTSGRVDGTMRIDGKSAPFEFLELALKTAAEARRGELPPSRRFGATDAEGRFVFDGLRPGIWRVRWWPKGPGYWHLQLAEMSFEIRPDATTNIEFEPEVGSLVVRTTDSVGKATGWVHFGLQNRSGYGEGVFETPGTALLEIEGLPAGRYALTDAYYKNPLEFELEPGEREEIVFEVKNE